MITRRLAPLCALAATACLGSASASGSYSGSGARRRDNSPRLVDSYDLVVSVPETTPRRAFRNVHVDVLVSAIPADSTTDIETYAVASIVRTARPVVADSVAAFLGARRDLDAADLVALRAPLREIAQRQLVGWVSKDRTPRPYQFRLDLVGLYFADGPSAAAQSRSVE